MDFFPIFSRGKSTKPCSDIPCNQRQAYDFGGGYLQKKGEKFLFQEIPLGYHSWVNIISCNIYQHLVFWICVIIHILSLVMMCSVILPTKNTHVYLVSGLEHQFYDFPSLGMSSSQLTVTPWFFRGVGWKHQPGINKNISRQSSRLIPGLDKNHRVGCLTEFQWLDIGFIPILWMGQRNPAPVDRW